MKLLLAAVNAKYIHSNPAVYLLRAFAAEFKDRIEIAEYTVNELTEKILADIYRRKPDVIAFSCYLWNRSVIEMLLTELPKICPELPVFLGGPEAYYDAPVLLRRFPAVTGIMEGEGEMTFRELCRHYLGSRTGEASPDASELPGTGCASSSAASSSSGIFSAHRPDPEESSLSSLRGLWLRDAAGEPFFTGERPLLPMDEVPFFYEEWADDPELGPFKNRILYYETSRGCPFSCSYCLSSVDKTVRLRSLEKVFPELQFFLDRQVPQVKFIDRTFNCAPDRAAAVWRYLLEHDNGVTNFHFEIAADLLTDEALGIFRQMRPGLIQLEIGVQTVNERTLREIRRRTDLGLIRSRVTAVRAPGNIRQHLDLIAGLPEEDLESFIRSFNEVYAMGPDQLQLGFLKVLKGAYMSEAADAYGLRYLSRPPYEVLSTRWLSYAELRQLKAAEEMLEIFHNSEQFRRTLSYLVPMFPAPYVFFQTLAAYYEERGFSVQTPARSARYDILFSFACERFPEKTELWRELLTCDYYVRELPKHRPDFARDLSPWKEQIYAREKDKRDHIEVFFYPVFDKEFPSGLPKRSAEAPYFVRFDYTKKDRLRSEAATREV